MLNNALTPHKPNVTQTFMLALLGEVLTLNDAFAKKHPCKYFFACSFLLFNPDVITLPFKYIARWFVRSLGFGNNTDIERDSWASRYQSTDYDSDPFSRMQSFGASANHDVEPIYGVLQMGVTSLLVRFFFEKRSWTNYIIQLLGKAHDAFAEEYPLIYYITYSACSFLVLAPIAVILFYTIAPIVLLSFGIIIRLVRIIVYVPFVIVRWYIRLLRDSYHHYNVIGLLACFFLFQFFVANFMAKDHSTNIYPSPNIVEYHPDPNVYF